MAGPPNQAMEAQVQSSFPLPPKLYFEQYTKEAMALGTAPKPPEPIGNTYQMFGQVCHQDDPIIRPLESQDLVRLHPQVYDKRKELKKMSLSIICNFLDLLDIIVKAADSSMRDEKLEDLNLLFIHIHHLINEFRPHQARETLKVLMEMQQRQVLEVGERLWTHIEKAEAVLTKCSQQIKDMENKHYQQLKVEESLAAGRHAIVKMESVDNSSMFATSSSIMDSQDNIPFLQADIDPDKNQALLEMIDKIEE